MRCFSAESLLETRQLLDFRSKTKSTIIANRLVLKSPKFSVSKMTFVTIFKSVYSGLGYAFLKGCRERKREKEYVLAESCSLVSRYMWWSWGGTFFLPFLFWVANANLGALTDTMRQTELNPMSWAILPPDSFTSISLIISVQFWTFGDFNFCLFEVSSWDHCFHAMVTTEAFDLGANSNQIHLVSNCHPTTDYHRSISAKLRQSSCLTKVRT